MITAVVTIKLPEGLTRAQWLENTKAIAARFQTIPGLIRKQFLYSDRGVGGGVYLWETREAAADPLVTPTQPEPEAATASATAPCPVVALQIVERSVEHPAASATVEPEPRPPRRKQHESWRRRSPPFRTK